MNRSVSMLAKAAALSSFGAFTCIADAQTRVILEASLDGGFTWQGGTVFSAPGNVVHVRVRVAFVGTQTVLGLAGCTFQPTLSNFHPSDAVLPFSTPNGACVPEGGGIGRVTPFCSSSMNTGSAPGLLTAFRDPGNVLRFAGSKCTTLTTQLSWGVGIAQPPESLAGTSFHRGPGAVVFQYAFLPQGIADFRIATIPPESLSAGRVTWYIQPSGVGNTVTPVAPSDIFPVMIGDFGAPPCAWSWISQPQPRSARIGESVSFSAAISDNGFCRLGFSFRWQRDGMDLSDDARLTGTQSPTLSISNARLSDNGNYRLTVAYPPFAPSPGNAARLDITACPADTDDGSGTGTPDGGVTGEDLLFYLYLFAEGDVRADKDDGSGTGTPDGGVTGDDLLYFLARFEAGC